MKKRLFVDMDGTLAEFRPTKNLEELYEPGYFIQLRPIANVVDMINRLAAGKDIEVFILSAYLEDSKTALVEKNMWIDEYVGEIGEGHRLFLPCGMPKILAVPNYTPDKDYLLDDYTKNLLEWPMEDKAIKLLNGINGKGGNWKGFRISCDQSSEIMEKLLKEKILQSNLMRKERTIK